MPSPMDQIELTIEGCLKKKGKLTVGEVEILESLKEQRKNHRAMSFVDEQELQRIAQKLGLA